MTILFILLLLILTFCLLVFNYKKISLVFLIITIICLLSIGCGFLPRLLLTPLQAAYLVPAQPIWEENNAIVILGAGASKLPLSKVVKPMIMGYSRIYETARLYLACKKSGKKCTIIASGGDASHTGVPEAVAYQEALLKLGITATDIHLESHSMNTYQNAKLTSVIIKKGHFNKVILVSSGLHLKRASLYFSNFAIYPVPAPSDYIVASISSVPLGSNFAVTDMALHEYGGIIRFHLYNYLGWNTKHES